ncbi:MAG: DUF3352 domain-containing protein [Leptolyngbya sp. Prado105]|nr:DUF3352 domain-containing protein [Leptolyngbya sp. Prado105]
MALKKLILPGLAVTALVGGVAGFFFLNGTSSDKTTPLAIAKVLPDEAYMAAFISTDDKNWEKLKKFGTPDAQKAIEQSFQKMRQDMMSDSKVDFDKDLKPWMGNTMVAILPSSKKDEVEVVAAIAIKDKVSALNFANKVKSDSKAKTTETDYKGVKIVETVTEKSKEPSYTAVLNDSYLIMASSRTGIEQSIEAMKGSASFASNPETATQLAQKDSGEAVIARIYMPIPAMAKAMSADPKMDAAAIESLKNLQSVSGTLSITDVGLRLKGEVKVDPKIAMDLKPSPGKASSLFPADTFALLSGSNLSSYWNQVAEQSETNADAKKFIDLMRGSSQMIGLDLDKDVFGWMTGEFAIGMMPTDQGVMAQLGFGQAMVFQTSDRKAAEATLGKLDTLAKSQSLSIAARDVNGKKVTEWQTPQGVLLGHGWINDDTMFIATGDQLVSTFSSQPNPALNSSDGFKTVMAALPQQNTGYFYMDVEKMTSLMSWAGSGSLLPYSTLVQVQYFKQGEPSSILVVPIRQQ